MDIDYKAPGSVSLFDSGWGLYLLRAVLFIVLSVFILGGYAVVNFHGLRQREAMEIAETARNMSESQGYTTQSVTPFDIWYLQKQGQNPDFSKVPDMHHAPGYPVLLSWVFRILKPDYKASSDSGIFDAEYKAIIPLGIILTLLCSGALFYVGLQLFDMRIAATATVIFIISNLTLGSMISGLPLPLLTLAVTLACGFALRAVYFSVIGGHAPKMILLIIGSAVFTAVAVLTDYTMIAIAVGLMAVLAVQLQRLRWVSILLFVTVTTLLVSPWLMHNHKLGIGAMGAKPYDAIAGSSLYQDDSLSRTVEPVFNSYRVTRALRHKVVSSVAEDINGSKAVAGGLILCFFVLALFHRYEKNGVSALKWLVLSVILMLMLLTPLIGPSYTVLSSVFPLVVLLGVSAFVDYVDREEFFEPGMQMLLVWLLIILSALPAVAQVIKGSKAVYPPYYAPIQEFVCSMLDESETLYTDMPWATAWYGDRNSVLVPLEIADVAKITNGWTNVGGVYLTSETAGKTHVEKDGWRDILYHKVPESVPFKHAIELPSGRGDQIFLSDRPRWE
jgi:hypothetical protein